MKFDVTVSVIVPVFNVKPYLSEALDSVLSQTYSNLEVIIVDDGSYDGSNAICDEYAKKDDRITVYHQANKGLSSARNVGLNHATGGVIAFLDPDDAFYPETIELMMNVMKKESADVVICDFQSYQTQERMGSSNAKRTDIECKTINKSEALQLIYDKKINTAVWNKIYIKKIWEDLRFPDGYVYEGTYIVLDLFDKANTISFLDEPLVMHRIRPNSICNTHSLKYTMDGEYAVDHFLSYMIDHSPDDFSYDQIKRFIQNRIKRVALAYLYYQWNNPEDVDGIHEMSLLFKNVGSETALQYCSIPCRIGYNLVTSCPMVCGFLYNIFRNVKDRFIS